MQQTITTALVVWPQPGRARRSALRMTVQNVLRAVASCAGASAGAAAMVFLWPPGASSGQWRTHFGIAVGDVAANTLVTHLTDAWVEQ